MHTLFCKKKMVLSCWQWKMQFCFGKGCRIIGKEYLMVLKNVFLKAISDIKVTDGQSLDTIIHQ